jgi:hypothetical protein
MHQSRAERHWLAVFGSHLRNPHIHRANARLNGARWVIAVANNCRMTRCRACVRKLSDKTFKLSFKS